MSISYFPKTYWPCRLQANARLARPTVRRARFVRRQAHSDPYKADSDRSTPGVDELPPELRDLAINEDGFLIDTKTGKVINEMGATRFDVAVRALRGELDPPSWVENSERTPGVILSALYQFPKSYLFQVVGRNTAASNPTDPPASATNTAAARSSSPPASTIPPRYAPSSGGGQGAADPLYEAVATVALKASAVASSGSGSGEHCSPGQSPVREEGSVGSSGAAESFVRDVMAVISRVTQTQVERDKVEVKERLSGKYVSVAVEVVVRAPELVNMVYDELAKDPRVIMKF